MDETPLPPNVDPSALSEIAKGVFVIGDRRVPLVPNIGVVLGDDTALVIDTGMGPANGVRVLEVAKDLAGSRPLILTLTHFHPEHGFGAQAFKGAAKIIYNEAQRDELKRKGEAFLGMFRTFGPAVAAALEGTKIVEPDEVYSGPSATIDLGGRSVEMRATGKAHTLGDQTVHVPDCGVVFWAIWRRNGCSRSFRGFHLTRSTLTRRIGRASCRRSMRRRRASWFQDMARKAVRKSRAQCTTT